MRHKHDDKHRTPHDERHFARPPHGEHDHGERHHRGRTHGGSRLARLLEHGDLRMLILHLVAEKPRHGYEIIKAIEDLAGGAYAPSPGVVYPTLTMLEDLGHVASTTEGTRKSYTISEAGRQTLAAEQKTVTAILERIARAQPRPDAPTIIRAVENLKTALRLKLGNKDIAPETTRKIADAIDAVARQIEDL